VGDAIDWLESGEAAEEIPMAGDPESDGVLNVVFVNSEGDAWVGTFDAPDELLDPDEIEDVFSPGDPGVPSESEDGLLQPETPDNVGLHGSFAGGVTPNPASQQPSNATANLNPNAKVFGSDFLWPTTGWHNVTYPYRTNGYIRAENLPEVAEGSGTKVGPRHIVTAGHVLWDQGVNPGPSDDQAFWTDGWQATFTPGQDGLGVRPNGGPYRIQGAYFRTEWFVGLDQHYDTAIALVVDNATLVSMGWLGLCSSSGTAIEAENLKLYAYPRENCYYSPTGVNQPCGGYLYRDIATLNDDCDVEDSISTELMYTCDTLHGMSGGAVWRSQNNCAYGTHTRYLHDGDGDYNRAHRFNSNWVNWMIDEMICKTPSAYATYGGC
jgi:hypothetical protein